MEKNRRVAEERIGDKTIENGMFHFKEPDIHDKCHYYEGVIDKSNKPRDSENCIRNYQRAIICMRAPVIMLRETEVEKLPI
ncbi:MAG: hypothetical protein LBB24_00280 [Rickettsiales bacterium]|nr:hypothetical protein [Rickettsiales bacterium]